MRAADAGRSYFSVSPRTMSGQNRVCRILCRRSDGARWERSELRSKILQKVSSAVRFEHAFFALSQISSVGHLSESRLALALGRLGWSSSFPHWSPASSTVGLFPRCCLHCARGGDRSMGARRHRFWYRSARRCAAGTISLVLVFFTDAIKINVYELRRNWFLPALALGPGALLTILFTTLVAHWLFGSVDRFVADRRGALLDRRGPAA